MTKTKSKLTQANLDAANKEAQQYLDQVIALRKEREAADENAKANADRLFLNGFIQVIEKCKIPNHIFVTAGCCDLGRTENHVFHMAMGDLRTLAEAIKRRAQ